MLRKRRLEHRLFGWLTALAVLPALLVLAASLVIGSRSLRWMGTLGPWNQVAESGRVLIEAAERAPADSALLAAAERHRQNLSSSLMQANRWSFLGNRLAAALPALMGVYTVLLAVIVLLLSRWLARDLARPIGELVDWAERMGRNEPLPANGHDTGEPLEVQVLRKALRNAAAEIDAARSRDLEAERTRAWGEMARRVAHEMKNPLTPLRLAAHRIAKQSPADAGLLDAAAVIREEIDRLDELARSFAALGRPAPGPATEVDLAELLRGLLETDIPDNIRSTLEAGKGTSSVIGHYDALQRAFRNVIRNAVEAVGGASPGAIDVRIASDDNVVEVVVADDGPGIPADLAEAIFEPDRTLKARGTGLGLAIVHQVTAAHGGTVAARNRTTGRGAEFIIRLPKRPHGAHAPEPRGQA